MWILSDEQKVEICSKYLKDKAVTCTALGKIYGINRKSIANLLKNRGITVRTKLSGKKRIYDLYENFFEEINSEEKAYFLGLLYADGYVNPKTKLIGVTLQEEDKELLEKLRIIIGYSKPLVYRTFPKHPTWKNVYVLDMYSTKMYFDVVKLGCVPKKSLILKFPTENQVPKELLRHFIRGYWDGDGSISYYVKVVSSFNFLKKLQKILINMNIESKINDMACNDTTKTLSIYKNKDSIPFLNWIYKDSSIYMNRKYLSYLELKGVKKVSHLGTPPHILM